jgi:hypothetical protein
MMMMMMMMMRRRRRRMMMMVMMVLMQMMRRMIIHNKIDDVGVCICDTVISSETLGQHKIITRFFLE